MSHLLTVAVSAASTAGSSASTAKPVSIFSLMFQLIIGLAVVLGLIWVASRIMRGRITGTTAAKKRRGMIHVLGRQTLGKGVQLAVVKAGADTYLLGITGQQVTRLARYEPDLMEELDAIVETSSEVTDSTHPAGSAATPAAPDVPAVPARTRAATGAKAPSLRLSVRKPDTQRPIDLLGGGSPALAVQARFQSAIRQLQDRTVRRG